MKRSRLLSERFRYGNGPWRGRWGVYHVARIPIDYKFEFSGAFWKDPVGAALYDAFCERGKKTVPLRDFAGILRRHQVFRALTRDESKIVWYGVVHHDGV